MRPFDNRTIICGAEVYEALNKKFPNRPISYTPYCPAQTFYWFDIDGGVRIGKKGSCIILGLDHEKGYPYTKVIRKLKESII